jgi:hypothetical protein
MMRMASKSRFVGKIFIAYFFIYVIVPLLTALMSLPVDREHMSLIGSTSLLTHMGVTQLIVALYVSASMIVALVIPILYLTGGILLVGNKRLGRIVALWSLNSDLVLRWMLVVGLIDSRVRFLVQQNFAGMSCVVFVLMIVFDFGMLFILKKMAGDGCS